MNRRGQAATGDDGMHVRVVHQVLAPGVEHHQAADTGSQMSGIGGDFQQRASGSLEQDAVDHALILQGQGREFVGNVNTTWKYGTGSNSLSRFWSQAARASAWHLGQCRLRQELY